MFLGADLGGSRLRIVVVDGRRVVARKEMTGCEPEGLPLALARSVENSLLRRVVGIVVGSTRLGNLSRRRAVERGLKKMFPRVLAMTDMDLAHRAAFEGKVGVLIIAGTGSAAYGRTLKGRSARAGGLGPGVGDEGSAYWLGREYLRAAPQARAPKPGAIAETAALAKKFLQRARRDASIMAIVHQGQRALIGQAETVARKLRLKPPVPLALHGGLFQNDIYLAAFKRNLKTSKVRWKIINNSRAAADAAAELARQLFCRIGSR